MTDLNPKYTVVDIKGQAHEVFMSLGLVQTLSLKIISIEQLLQITMDHALIRELLNETLAKRDASGKRIDDKDYTLELSVVEGDKLITWVVKHVNNFFILNFQKLESLKTDLQPIVEALSQLLPQEKDSEPSQTGSKP